MDCFFAAIEMRDNPTLRNVPMAVGGRPENRGVIATANYLARTFGVKSALSSAQALRLCPHLVIVNGSFEKYRQEAQAIRGIFHQFTDLVESVSLDEAYLEVTDSLLYSGSATLLAGEIRKQIELTCGITASAGIAPNKFLAKVGSDWNKPNGMMTIAPHQIDTFVRKLPVCKIPGVGKVTGEKLRQMGVSSCADLQLLDQELLTARFGKWGKALFSLCRGIDDRPVSSEHTRKSLSVEHTFDHDLKSSEVGPELISLVDEFNRRFKKMSSVYRINGMFVKVKFSDFHATTIDDCRLNTPITGLLQDMLVTACGRSQLPVRLVGVGARLEPIDGELVLYRQLWLPFAEFNLLRTSAS